MLEFLAFIILCILFVLALPFIIAILMYEDKSPKPKEPPKPPISFKEAAYRTGRVIFLGLAGGAVMGGLFIFGIL